MEWMLMPLRRYAEFSGRSRRKEFWMYTLGVFIVFFILFVLMLITGGSAIMSAASNPAASGGALAAMGVFGIVIGLLWLAILIPSLAVAVRRLHDTDRTGWWVALPIGIAVLTGIVGSGSTLGTILNLLYLASAILLLVFYCIDGTKGPNRFGEDPKGGASAEVFT